MYTGRQHVYLATVVNTWGDVTHYVFLVTLVCVFLYQNKQFSALSDHDNLIEVGVFLNVEYFIYIETKSCYSS